MATTFSRTSRLALAWALLIVLAPVVFVWGWFMDEKEWPTLRW
jgi:hypothetical protein